MRFHVGVDADDAVVMAHVGPADVDSRGERRYDPRGPGRCPGNHFYTDIHTQIKTQ